MGKSQGNEGARKGAMELGGRELFFSGRTQGEKGKACGRIGKL